MRITRYINCEPHTYPVAPASFDEPCFDGFEQVVDAANYGADLVLISDWLGTELAEVA